jgi:acetolactate synthase-1/2/3 large subunit
VTGQTVSLAMARMLVERGTHTIFSLMSDDTARLVLDLDAAGCRVISTRHEHAAVGAADGYARSSGTVGVVVIGRGPGLTNALNALITAQKARSRVLVVVGESPNTPGREEIPERFGKDIAQARLLEAVEVPHVRVRSAGTALADLAAALDRAAQGSPVVLSVPPSVFAQLAGDEPSSVVAHVPSTVQEPEAHELADVLDLLMTEWACRRPVILAGSGAVQSNAKNDLVRIGDRIGAVYGTTLPARSLFADQDRNLGIIGTFATPIASELLRTADVVLAFGVSLNANTTYGQTLFPNARIVHVDNDPAAIGLYAPAELVVHGDAALTARALAARLAEADYSALGFRAVDAAQRLAEYRPDYRDMSRPGALDPRTVMPALDALLPRERNVVIDPGHHFAFGVPSLQAPEPGAFIAPLEYGAVGCGIGPALGICIAHPERVTVLSIGDGGLMMTLGDLDTAVRYCLPLIVIVNDDGGFGSEVQFLRVNGLPDQLALTDNPSFAAVATALGADAITITELGDLERVAAKIAHLKGPLLIDVKTNRDVRGDWVDFFYGREVVATPA